MAGIDALDEKIKVIALEDALPKSQNPVVGPEVPAAIREVQEKTFDERLEELNRVPLFMRQLDETDGAEGENAELEALKSLAYEGEPWEIATSFKQNGNESFSHREYKDAVEYYTKALQVKCGRQEIDEQCLLNRAQCNLFLENYGKVLADCSRVLRINPTSIKALYRSAKACVAVDRIDEAQDVLERGLKLEPDNKAFQTLFDQHEKKLAKLLVEQQKTETRKAKKAAERDTLAKAIAARKIVLRTSPRPPDMGDACIRLSDPQDMASSLVFPVLFLYPLTFQSDFLAQFPEVETMASQIDMVLAESPPWDAAKQYTPANVDLFIETVTGTVFKLGRKITLGAALGTGKVEVWDSLVQIYVVPKSEAQVWVEQFKADAPKRRRG